MITSLSLFHSLFEEEEQVQGPPLIAGAVALMAICLFAAFFIKVCNKKLEKLSIVVLKPPTLKGYHIQILTKKAIIHSLVSQNELEQMKLDPRLQISEDVLGSITAS